MINRDEDQRTLPPCPCHCIEVSGTLHDATRSSFFLYSFIISGIITSDFFFNFQLSFLPTLLLSLFLSFLPSFTPPSCEYSNQSVQRNFFTCYNAYLDTIRRRCLPIEETGHGVDINSQDSLKNVLDVGSTSG
jgi:hypothetical protein